MDFILVGEYISRVAVGVHKLKKQIEIKKPMYHFGK